MIEAVFVFISLKLGVAMVGEPPRLQPSIATEVVLEQPFEAGNLAAAGPVHVGGAPTIPGVETPGNPVRLLGNEDWPLGAHGTLGNEDWPL